MSALAVDGMLDAARKGYRRQQATVAAARLLASAYVRSGWLVTFA